MRRKNAYLIGLSVLAMGVGLFVTAAASAATTDFSVTQTDSADPVEVGDNVAYTVTVQDNGPGANVPVTLTYKLSNRLDFVSATPSQGTCDRNGRTIVCELGVLSVYEPSATVVIRAKAAKTGTATNEATVSPTNNADNDPTGANDTATETTKIVAAGGGGGAQCAGRKATIVGTPGADTLVGTAGRDVIQAGRGNDVIRGLSNKDIVCAGGGADTVRGGDDADVLKGGRGDDLLKGGRGDDLLKGGRGDDRCRGGAGDDIKKGC
jgi:uncharacterized repeat protein (TIGR01451 family)